VASVRDLDSVFFARSAPHIFFEDNVFHIEYEIGKRAHIEVVMSPERFLETRAAAAEALAKWQLGSIDKVAPLKKKR
jgi:hypothetical protein